MNPVHSIDERHAYFCGEWIPESRLSISVADLGFAMGVTVTERLRTFGGKVYRKTEHLARLQRSLEQVGLDHQALMDEIDSAIDEFVVRHESQFSAGDDWAIVAFATPGSGSGPTVCVHGFPLAFGDWAHQFTAGVKLRLSSFRQVPPNCWPAEIKCRSRLHYYLADEEVRQVDPDCRALLLDQDGFVAEASTANVVVYTQSDGLRTPRFGKVLKGVSVGVIEELAAQLGVAYREVDITPEELPAADEIWLASTSVCMLPVTQVDDSPISGGKPGPMYAQFLNAWGELVDTNIAQQAQLFARRP